jgi:hypothetical protein
MHMDDTQEGKEKKRLPLLQSYARKISHDIGPRPPASRAEARAAEFIEATMASRGVPVEVESFRAGRGPFLAPLLCALLPLAAVVLFPLSPIWGFLLATAGYVYYQAQAYGADPLGALLRRGESANVISRAEPKDPPAKGAVKLVLLSHYDSPTQPQSRFLAGLFGTRSGSRLMLASVGIIFMLYLLGVGAYVLKAQSGLLSWVWSLSLLPALPSLLLGTYALDGMLRGKPSAGADDNASGVAVLLALQRRFTRRPPQNLEVWFVATGSGTAGAAGLKNLLHEHGSELRKAYFVNIDRVGGKATRCWQKEGLLLSFRANRRLLAHARRLADRHTQYGVELARSPEWPGECLRLLSSGRRAMTISSLSQDGRAGDDAYEGLDAQVLRRVYDFMVALMQELDEACRGSRLR